MAKMIKVKTKSVIDYNPVGTILNLPKGVADNLISKKYAEFIEEVKPKPKTKKKSESKSNKEDK